MNITLKNVRLSFPSVFTGRAFQEGDIPKFSATALMQKEDSQTKKLHKLIEKFIADNFEKKDIKKVKVCLKDGAEKEDIDGYGEEIDFLSASSKKRPAVVARDRSPLVEEDGVIFGGCYVNMAIRIWAQDNKWGKRVNAELLGVQFVKEGEPFGEGVFKAEAAFEDLSDEGDDEDYSDML